MRSVCIAIMLAIPAVDIASAQDVRINAQVRPRFEFRDPVPGAARDDFVSMRSRLGASVGLPDGISLLVQVQDVRLWGQDATLDGSPAGFPELHQGYLAIERLGGRTNAVRAGRQEIVLGSQRLIGNADWVQRARAFDGVRGTFGPPQRAIDVFSTRIADRSAGRPLDASFHGVYATLAARPAATLELYGLYNRARAELATDQGTLGARLAASPGSWSVETEAAYQFGERAGRDVSAFMLRAAAGPVTPPARVLLSFEHYSGGDPAAAEVRAFDTLFGTPHAFLGFADVFTNIPAHTAGRGIQDFSLRTMVTPRPGTELFANAHAFRVASLGGLESRRFGEELDVRLRQRVRQPLTLTGGFSYVWHGPALAAIGRLDRDMTFLYVMLNAAF